jgi:tryptophanyl-tRNA synthetase
VVAGYPTTTIRGLIEGIPSEAKGLEGRPEAENLVGIFAALTDQPVDNVLREFGGQQFSAFKKALAGVATDKLGRIGGEASRLMQDPAEIDRTAGCGACGASLSPG